MRELKKLNWIWLALLASILAVRVVRTEMLCPYLATDFRGYYASAQIALDQGFHAVYDLDQQQAYQQRLPLRCPQGETAPLITVAMPYLPVFVLLFLPLTWLDFTLSYGVWLVLNVFILALYLLRFTRLLGEPAQALALLLAALPWLISLPVLSTLALGQWNLWLLLCLGEFLLAYLQGRSLRSGIWLAGLLMKPHLLILLLPGLALARHWRVLAGFVLGGLAVLSGSLLLGGMDALSGSLRLMAAFAGPLIQSAAYMMNWRALALNLLPLLPAWLAWGVAVCGMALTAWWVLRLWRQPIAPEQHAAVLRLCATLAGTFLIAWHSHFYLQAVLIPPLFWLARRANLPAWLVGAWLLLPLSVYALLYPFDPEWARRALGLATLAVNLLLLAHASGIRLAKL